METLEMEKSLLDDVMVDLEIEPKKQKKRIISPDDVLVVVLLYRNAKFDGIIKPYNIEICGRKMFEWVELSAKKYEVKTIQADEYSNVVELIKPLLNDKPTTFVLYSDTPLLTASSIDEILDYFYSSNLNVLKLKRGYVFNTDYLRKISNIASGTSKEFEERDFDPICDAKSLEKANKVLNDRIVNFHLLNGVLIENIKSTFIDADVIIEPGVKIAPNNVLKGETYIGKNVVLEPNNTIISSIISSGCDIRSSYIKNSKITENMVVGPFEMIDGKES